MRRAMMLATVISTVFAGYVLVTSAVGANTQDQFDVAGTYKSKCVACHGQAAEKKFDVALADTELVQAVLKGKKGEKPPNMPAYEDKGINEDQAKALVAHMKSLKK